MMLKRKNPFVEPNTTELRTVNKHQMNDCKEISNNPLLIFLCYLLWKVLAKGIS